jgi:Phage terminase large subunit (GpA)
VSADSTPDPIRSGQGTRAIGGGEGGMSEFVSAFRALRAAREAERSTPAADGADFLVYAERIPEPKRGPLDFARYPFQVEMYRALERPREAVVQKSTQVGASALLIRWALYWAGEHGQTALYVFPHARHLDAFYDTRVKPLFKASAYLRSRSPSGSTQNKSLRQIGSGFVLFRGSESEDELQAIDADVLALDEYDDLKANNIPDAERRVSGSLHGLIRRIGVPTEPEWGIALRYAESDMRRWLVKCEHCNEHQPLDFWANVDQSDPELPRMVCRRCGKPINVANGEWVAEHPDRETVGFHVSRLMVPRTDLRQIVVASKKQQPVEREAFFRKDLGLPYTPAESGLDRDAIAAAISAAEAWNGAPLGMVQGYRGTNPVTMGVDVASVRNLHVRISEHIDGLTAEGHRKRALWIGEIGSFGEILDLLGRYQVACCVIDHLPEGRLAYGIAERFPGLVYVCHYSDRQPEPLVLRTEDRRVSVQRSPAHDAVVHVMRALRNLLPGDVPEEYGKHMRSPRKKVERDETTGQQKVVWTRQGPDDFFQADLYDLIATEVLRIRLEVRKLVRPQITRLDDHLQFERSRVADPDNMEYDPGPGDPNDDFYYPG